MRRTCVSETAMTVSSTAAPEHGREERARPRHAWDLSYRARLMLGVRGLVLFTGAVITWLAHRSARASTEVLARGLFREVSRHAVTHTRNFLLGAEPLVKSLQDLGHEGQPALDDSEQLAKQLLPFLKGHS